MDENQNFNNNNAQNANMNGNNVTVEVDSNVANEWGEFSVQDANANKVMAILAYIIPLIPFLAEKNSKWVRFHSIQGMNFWVIAIAIYVLLMIIGIIAAVIPFIGWLLGIVLVLIGLAVSFAILALDVIGIINVIQNKAKELPVVSKIKIFKK